MSAHSTLHCDGPKCTASITGGLHQPEPVVRNIAVTAQGWTSRTRLGIDRTWTYDYCREHSNQ